MSSTINYVADRIDRIEPDKTELAASYQSQLESVGVPTNQAKSAADVLASQTKGELPVPLAEGSEELHILRSAYSAWMIAKQSS